MRHRLIFVLGTWVALLCRSSAFLQESRAYNNLQVQTSYAENVNSTLGAKAEADDGDRIGNGTYSIRSIFANDVFTVSKNHLRAWLTQWKACTVIGTLVLSLALLFAEVRPPYVILLCALVFVWWLNIISTETALKGFSSDALITVGALFVVVKGVDRSRLIDAVARSCLGQDSSEQMALVRFNSLVLVIGSFIASTPLVALLMPIIRDWARSRDFAPSKFLLPLAYACTAGGTITLIGSQTNLIINTMLRDATGMSFSFFAPAFVGVFLNTMSMVYMLTIGVHLLPDHQGGLFRTLKERKRDMLTELQVPTSFPLVGTDIREALDQLNIPKEALVKIFRQPPRPRTCSGPFSLSADRRSPHSRRERGVTFNVTEADDDSPQDSDLKRAVSSPPSSLHRQYSKRTAHCWGGRTNTVTFAPIEEIPISPVAGHDLSDPAVREIFPVPEHEVLQGADVLLLSLPQEQCIALSDPQRWNYLLQEEKSSGSSFAAGDDVSLKICDVDLLELPGRQNEFVELVVSQTNQFVGCYFDEGARRKFETFYQVAILAVRQGREWARKDGSVQDQLPSKTHGKSMAVLESNTPMYQAAASCPSLGIILPEADSVEDKAHRLLPGDTILVLTSVGAACERLQTSPDFLVATLVAHQRASTSGVFDYVPIFVFALAIAGVALQLVSMVQVSVAMAALFLAGGWVDPSKLRELVDWNMLVMIGSALGLAEAVKASGISSMVASSLLSAHVGAHGTVFLLFFMTMLLNELISNNAAAALGVPLALDLTKELGLASPMPLVMTVLLASSTSYASPVGSSTLLMVMGPGGYSFQDFLKVGLPMDLINWFGCCLLLPMVWPLQTLQ